MARAENSEMSPVTVSDTRDISCEEPFDYFREAVVHSLTPWGMELNSSRTFAARVEGVNFDGGFIKEVRALPHIADRTSRHVANSSVEGYFIIFMLGGELVVEQCGAKEVAHPGDLVIFDSRRPSRMSYSSETTGQYSISLFAPRGDFAAIQAARHGFGTLLLRRERLLKPLTTCLSFISDNLLACSKDELAALYEACLPLVSLTAGRGDQEVCDQRAVLRSDYLLKEVLDYIHRHIASPGLSPMLVASTFRISDRYLHKLFARTGSSFGSYVTSKRLDEIASELVSQNGRFEPIAAIAYRWGFNDISNFNRLFKKKFGCPPKIFRARSTF